MKKLFLVFLTACGADAFTGASDAATDRTLDAPEIDAWREEASSEAGIDAPDDVKPDAAIDAPPDVPPPTCDVGDLIYGGKCLYLDGTGGVCAQGYAVSSESALGSVLAGNANAFSGSNYRTKVSANCCVWTKDAVRNFGMVSHCNLPGPFGNGEPKYGGNSCTNQSAIVKTDQLTLCERPL